MKTQRKRGFTVIELVIVIAVVAVLAAVLIPTFVSITKKANESAYLQEKTNQKIDDLAQKVDNTSWLGWEDFEASIVGKITDAVITNGSETQLGSEVVQQAVLQAISNYYANNSLGNTALTEEQVKKIVENALTGTYQGVTAEQVTAIVNAAVSKVGTGGTGGVTASQVQAIVSSAMAGVSASGGVTSAQVSQIVANAVNSAKAELKSDAESAVNNIITTINREIANANKDNLTEAQVKAILSTIVLSQGSTTWITEETYRTQDTFTLEKAEDIVGLATLVNGGYDFDGKTIILPETVDMSGIEFTPIGNVRGKEFKGTIGGDTVTTITGLTLTEQFNALKEGYLLDCKSTGHMDKVGVGFVAYLGEGATLKNIRFEDVKIDIADTTFDGISVGVAVGYLDGGTIENVTVSGGYVKNIFRVGGLCGAAAYGTIKNCKVENVTLESKGYNGQVADGYNGWMAMPSTLKAASYHDVGYLAGVLRQFLGNMTDNTENMTLYIDGFTATNITAKTIMTVGNDQNVWSIGENATRSSQGGRSITLIFSGTNSTSTNEKIPKSN